MSSFVSRLSPKQVETQDERNKLMFRIKMQVPHEQVFKHIEKIKSDIRGVAYVKFDDSVEWPENLNRLFPDDLSQNEVRTMIAPVRTDEPSPHNSDVEVVDVTQVYGKTLALDSVSLEIPAGKSLGLIGPDGVGKSTLLGLLSSARKMQTGAVYVFEGSMAMMMLLGCMNPLESQPDWLQRITWFLPSRQYMSFAQAIAFRGVGFENVWPEFVAMCGLGLAAFLGSLVLFRRSISATGQFSNEEGFKHRGTEGTEKSRSKTSAPLCFITDLLSKVACRG